MPNWCSNSFYIRSKTNNKADILKFYMDMSIAISSQPNFVPVRNDWDQDWIGNLFLAAGFNQSDLGSLIQCRGSITDISLIESDNGEIGVEIIDETAWEPNNESMELLIGRYSGLEMVYESEEPGCEIYVNSDTEGIYYKDRYRQEYSYDGDEYFEDYFEDAESAAKAVAAALGISYKEALMAVESNTVSSKYGDKFMEDHPGDDAFYSFHEFTEE